VRLYNKELSATDTTKLPALVDCKRGFGLATEVLAAIVLLVLLGATVWGQTAGSGLISGTLTDPRGGVVPGVTVTIKNTDTGIVRTVSTNGVGLYNAPFLQPGHYEVAASKTGFAKVVRPDVNLQVGQTLTVDLALPLQTASEAVTISAEGALVDTEKTELSQVVTEAAVSNLPIAGRRWDSFVLLTPNVTTDGTSGLVSYRGVSGLYNSNTVDGANNNQAFFSEARGRANSGAYVYSMDSMQEYQVTLEGETLSLPEPFIVIATQNPIEYEGTFPLPEDQLDRFMVKLSIGYPRPEEEDEILKRRAERKKDIVAINAIISPETFLGMRAATEEVYVDPDVRRYMVDLAAKSRFHRQVAVGISPRGSLALLKLTRAWAAIQGRSYVVPDDVKQFIQPALAHRIILDPSLWDVKKSENTVIAEISQSVSVPVLKSENE